MSSCRPFLILREMVCFLRLLKELYIIDSLVGCYASSSKHTCRTFWSTCKTYVLGITLIFPPTVPQSSTTRTHPPSSEYRRHHVIAPSLRSTARPLLGRISERSWFSFQQPINPQNPRNTLCSVSYLFMNLPSSTFLKRMTNKHASLQLYDRR